MKHITRNFIWNCLALGTVLLASFFMKTTVFAQEKTVDGQNPSPLALTGLSEKELGQNTLQLFDGKTFFGWQAIPVQTTMPKNLPEPVIAIFGGQMHISTEIPIRLRTPLLWSCSLQHSTSVEINWQNEKGEPSFESWNLLDENEKVLVKSSLLKETFSSEKKHRFLFRSQDSVPSQGGLDDSRKTAYFEIVLNKGNIAISSILYHVETKTDSALSSESVWKKPSGEMTLKVQSGEKSATVCQLSGKGYLESKNSYADFIATTRFRTIVDSTKKAETFCNSGIFFRCIPESSMNGYECQINNDPNEVDRTKFLGNDTGSIFRRIAARRITNQDNEWTWLTVMANGLTVRTWVNGIPTVVWTDTRKPDSNPRKGSRRDGGTLQIQGHDPWTSIEFDRFKILDKNN